MPGSPCCQFAKLRMADLAPSGVYINHRVYFSVKLYFQSYKSRCSIDLHIHYTVHYLSAAGVKAGWPVIMWINVMWVVGKTV